MLKRTQQECPPYGYVSSVMCSVSVISEKESIVERKSILMTFTLRKIRQFLPHMTDDASSMQF